MSKDIKKALEHCVDWDCGNCPNRDELGSGETVCRGRLLPEVLGYISDLETKLSESKKQCQQCKHLNKKIELNIKNKLMSEIAEKDKTITTLIEDSKISKELLKKQLTDKEQENERLKEEICKYEITLMDKNSQLKKQQQDKISFAVEQILDIKEKSFGTRETGIVFDIPKIQDVFNNIEDKLKELKEMK